MKVTVDDLSTVKKVLHIEIQQDDVAGKLDKTYKELKKTAKVKGFRPGKAPISALRRLYKKDVHADVSARLIQESFVDALKETEFDMVGNPMIDSPELVPGDPYIYKATIELKPTIENVDFKGLSLKKTRYQASNKEVDIQLKSLQKNLAKLISIEKDRPVQEGDFVLIDFEGFFQGQPINETEKTDNFTLKIGEGRIHKDFDNGLIGMKAQDNREFMVDFESDYADDNMAGKEISFHVKLHQIRKQVLPDIDEAFAKQLGDYQTVEELRGAIFDDLKQGYDKRAEQEINEQIYSALLEKTDFEVPDILINMELESIIQDAERSFEMRNSSLEEAGLSHDFIAEKYRDTAEKQVRRHLILGKIIEQVKLQLSDEDLENGFQEMATASEQSVQLIKNFYEKRKDNLAFFKHTLLEKQAIKLIIDHSDIEEVEPTSDPEPESTSDQEPVKQQE